MPDKIKSIGDILKKEPAFSKFIKSVKENDVVERFDEIFPDLSKIAKAVRVKNGALFLEVENSVWKSELNLNKNILIKKINNFFNDQIINSIRFK